jgi:hypothetical protein
MCVLCMKYRCVSQNTLLRNCPDRVRYELYLYQVIKVKLRRNGKVISTVQITNAYSILTRKPQIPWTREKEVGR